MTLLHEKFLQNIDSRSEGLKYIDDNHLKFKKTSHIKKFKELVNFNKKDYPEKAVKINNIIKDIEYIYETLIPLYKLGIHFSIHLVGGSVRDLVLNKEIKDLDIVIELTQRFPFLKPKKIKKHLGIDVNLIKEFEPVIINNNKVYLTEENKVFYLIRELIKNKINVNKEYDNTFKNKNKYIVTEEENTLFGYGAGFVNNILKIDDTALINKIDLMLSKKYISSIIDNFDIDLCKAYVTFVYGEKTKQKTFNFILNIDDFNHNIVLTNFFIEDAINKKLTIQVDNIDKNKLISTLDSHIYRLKEKYPDYEILFVHEKLILDDFMVNQDDIDRQQDKLNLIDSWKLSEQLKKLPNNDLKVKIKNKL